MTTYVHVAQIPLTLKFEEPHDAVLDHFRELITNGAVHRYEVGPDSSVVVNYGVVAALTVTEGHRALDVSELHRGLPATIGDDDPGAPDRVET